LPILAELANLGDYRFPVGLRVKQSAAFGILQFDPTPLAKLLAGLLRGQPRYRHQQGRLQPFHQSPFLTRSEQPLPQTGPGQSCLHHQPGLFMGLLQGLA
jgi:hypothetical protein